MEIIREIIRVATSHASSSIRILDPSIEQNALNHYLFHGIKENQFTTEDEAAKVLFGSDASDKRFSTLRGRFFDWISNTLFHLNIRQPEFTPYQEAIYQCNRRIFCARTLASFGARASATWFARRVLTKSQRYDLTAFKVQALEILREHSSYTGAEKEFELYTEELNAAFKARQAEIESDEYLYRLYMYYSKMTEIEDDVMELANRYAKDVEKVRSQVDTRTLALNDYRIRSIVSQIQGDYKETIRVCEEVERYFEENTRFASKARLAEFLLLKMTCYFYLNDYERGGKDAESCLVYFKKGTYNWYVFLEYYFLLAMHTRHWEKAAEIFREVVYHQSFRSQSEDRIEKWRIFESYLRYALEISDKEELLDSKATLMGRKFSLYKFLNEIPEFDADQRGRNISILVIQIMYLLEREDLDILVTRGRELDRYASKHLRKEDHYRSNCFLRSIRVMIDKNFDFERARALGEKYHRKISGTSLSYDGDFDSLEVIPYDQLWDRVLEVLKKVEMDSDGESVYVGADEEQDSD